MNRWTGTGRLYQPPRISYTQAGKARVSFLLLVPRNRGQTEKEEIDYIPIVAWGKTAEEVNDYAQQGAQIGVDGVLQTRNYTGQDGNKRYVTEVIANVVDYLDRRAEKKINDQ